MGSGEMGSAYPPWDQQRLRLRTSSFAIVCTGLLAEGDLTVHEATLSVHTMVACCCWTSTGRAISSLWRVPTCRPATQLRSGSLTRPSATPTCMRCLASGRELLLTPLQLRCRRHLDGLPARQQADRRGSGVAAAARRPVGGHLPSQLAAGTAVHSLMHRSAARLDRLHITQRLCPAYTVSSRLSAGRPHDSAGLLQSDHGPMARRCHNTVRGLSLWCLLQQ